MPSREKSYAHTGWFNHQPRLTGFTRLAIIFSYGTSQRMELPHGHDKLVEANLIKIKKKMEKDKF